MQKNHLASHIYHKHPHARKSSSSSSSSREGGASGHVDGGLGRVGGATGQVGEAPSREGRDSTKVGGVSIQGGNAADRMGVSPVRGGGGAPSPGLKSPNELLGFVQSMTSRNRLADLDVGGRGLSLREIPFTKGSPSAWESARERPSVTESLVLQEGSKGSPSAREHVAISEGLSQRGVSDDHNAAEMEDGSTTRSKLHHNPASLYRHSVQFLNHLHSSCVSGVIVNQFLCNWVRTC